MLMLNWARDVPTLIVTASGTADTAHTRYDALFGMNAVQPCDAYEVAIVIAIAITCIATLGFRDSWPPGAIGDHAYARDNLELPGELSDRNLTRVRNVRDARMDLMDTRPVNSKDEYF
ncbi:hypothetical protein P5V15_013292 [Pogonomyrmex californicus]